MLGLEAISTHNGWAMAATGIIIVMSGLAILAFIISQLHKVIGLFDEKRRTPPPAPSAPPVADIDALNNPDIAAGMYRPLTADIGDSFPLTDLYRIFEKQNLPHPHLTINALRDAGYLEPLGEGLFRWKNEDQQ